MEEKDRILEELKKFKAMKGKKRFEQLKLIRK